MSRCSRLPGIHDIQASILPGSSWRRTVGSFRVLTSRRMGRLIALLKDAGVAWSEDNAPRMGAALAYYAIFSLAPILVISIAIASFFFGKDAVTGQFAGQIEQLVGPEGAQAIQTMLANADKPGFT